MLTDLKHQFKQYEDPESAKGVPRRHWLSQSMVNGATESWCGSVHAYMMVPAIFDSVHAFYAPWDA